MGFMYFADGESNGLIRVDEVSGEGEQYQPKTGRWKWQPFGGTKTRFSGDYEPITEEQSRTVTVRMRDRFGDSGG